MQTVAFHNLGCKVNAYEMELMQQKFHDNGYEIVPFSEKADIYIVNTCTVTNIADRKSRQMLHRAKALNPEALVVAAGCYVETDREGAVNDECIDIVVGNKEKQDILEIIREYIAGTGTRGGTRGRFSGPEIMGPENRPLVPKNRPLVPAAPNFLTTLTEHTRAYIKIQDGCDQYCSYCIIPYSRGHVTSRPEEETLREIGALAQKGCREFVITGIHLSSYGLDRPYNMATKDGSFHNRGLTDIIKRIDRVEGVKRIRLGSLEPQIITDDFLEEMAEIRSFCPHFHLSLQSGSDSVLKRMNRRYTTEEYYEKVQLIRKYFEHPAITTDVIVGFPGETGDEFRQTRQFLDRVDFYETHIFAYSRRKGTVADRMPGQLTRREKNERSQILIADSAARARRFRDYYIGKPEEILIEETVTLDGELYQTGYNREYVKYACKPVSDDSGKSPVGNTAGLTSEIIGESPVNNHEDYPGRLITGRAEGFLNDELLLMQFSR